MTNLVILQASRFVGYNHFPLNLMFAGKPKSLLNLRVHPNKGHLSGRLKGIVSKKPIS
jgi:hypothetical protein